MNLTVYQTFNIQSLRIGGLSNSSIVQIGTAGIVKPLSNNYNTGRFTAPAPTAGAAPMPTEAALVPLASI